jgi:hypothetical protein
MGVNSGLKLRKSNVTDKLDSAPQPYLFVRIEHLATALKFSPLDEIAEIVKIAEKVSRAECGYTQEDLIEELVRFRNKHCCLIHRKVTLHSDEWDTVLYTLDCGGSIDIHDKIKEQL